MIGAGITGVCTAYWLSRSGLRVAVVDTTAIGAGATGRNGGFIPMGTTEPYPDTVNRVGRPAAQSLWTLTERNYALLSELISEEEIDCDFREPGHLHLALSEAELSTWSDCLQALTDDGFRWGELLDRAQAQDQVMTELGPRIVGGLHTSGGLAHSLRLLAGLATAAERRGTRFFGGRVVSLEPWGDSISIKTEDTEISAGYAVVATNAWLGDLVPTLQRSIVPVRGQLLATEPLPPTFPLGMSAKLTATSEYWHQLPTGEIVVGGYRAVRADHDRAVLTDEVTPDVQVALDGVLPGLFPSLPPLWIPLRWAGPMAFTADMVPIVDRAPDSERIWFAGGYSGHGIGYAAIVGALIAYSINTGAPAAALEVFSANRPSLKL